MTLNDNSHRNIFTRFFAFYRRNRVKIWAAVFILPVLLSIITFLVHIEVRNFKSTCFPDTTYWSCFSAKNLSHTLFGFAMYPINFYSTFFIFLFVPAVMVELSLKFMQWRNLRMWPNFAVITVLALMPLASPYAAEKTLTEEQIKKEFIDDCLTSSNDKYDLYKNCIGKFTNACAKNPKKYVKATYDSGFPKDIDNCANVESNWWQEVFEKNTDSLHSKSSKYLKNGAVDHELGKVIVSIADDDRLLACTSPAVDREEGKTTLICLRNLQAENAITVYLWNQKFKVEELTK